MESDRNLLTILLDFALRWHPLLHLTPTDLHRAQRLLTEGQVMPQRARDSDAYVYYLYPLVLYSSDTSAVLRHEDYFAVASVRNQGLYIRVPSNNTSGYDTVVRETLTLPLAREP